MVETDRPTGVGGVEVGLCICAQPGPLKPMRETHTHPFMERPGTAAWKR